MPPVLSKGGAASVLSATDPASVLAPSPETSCQPSNQSGVSQRNETNTQTKVFTERHGASGQQTPVTALLCLHYSVLKGWVVYPVLLSLPLGLAAERIEYRLQCLIKRKNLFVFHTFSCWKKESVQSHCLSTRQSCLGHQSVGRMDLLGHYCLFFYFQHFIVKVICDHTI